MPRLQTLYALYFAVLVCSAAATGGDNDSRALAWIYDRLKAPEASTRVAAAKELGAFRPVYRGAVLQLIRSLKDQDGEVRAAVQEALTSLANVKGFGKTAEGLSSPARAISLPGPRYPADALAAHLGGTVYLEFLVKTDGSVTNVRVLKSVPGLDDAAVEAAAHFIFAPPVKDGRLVETPAQAPIHFRVDSPPTGFEKP